MPGGRSAESKPRPSTPTRNPFKPRIEPVASATAPSSPKVLAEVAGTYQTVTGGPTVIEAAMTVEGGKLFAEATGGLPKDELLADSDSTFFTRTSGIPIVFERDAKKKVTGVTIDWAIKGKKVK